jgi:HPt (histidine-containing phosphotransfer) domain-containing protein
MHIARFSGQGGECGTSDGCPKSAHAVVTTATSTTTAILTTTATSTTTVTSTPTATFTDLDDGSDTTAALPALGAKDDAKDNCPLNLANGATIWGDMECYLVTIQSFKESLPEVLSSIEEAYQARDLERLSRECHTFKGSAGYAQAVQLVEATGILQDHGVDGIDKAYKQFAEEACRVKTYLDGDALLSAGEWVD